MTRHIPTYDLYGEKPGKKSEFWLHCETIPSRSSLHHWEIGAHRHESFFQILYIQAGSAEALFGGETHVVSPPAIVTVPPGATHGFRFSTDIEGLVITIVTAQLGVSPGERSQLGQWLSAPRLTPLAEGDDDSAYAVKTLERLDRECEGGRAGNNGLIKAYLTTILTLAARISAAGGEEAKQETGENERRVERLNGLIHRHYQSHKTASFYARELGMSLTHLNRVVREATGLSTHRLIARRLVEEAKRDLVFTLTSVQGISFRLGFSDPAYFSRFFLRETGMTPRAYRNAEQDKLAENPASSEN
ncbi:AraC family transcriptional regulator [Paramesorhizobium deserti]|uniref:AraC family transcriptional regulator n=1 Tax=Paramesorhizobium deserti TaxID=1494590 RepID=A0A135HQK3_9HYPH|nr:helix-turn-helix domain-containing protein [Paramesorhizobium deserti]KXF75413.1 AraC family transcriptional regulator [Paramesorhizobium deserti]